MTLDEFIKQSEIALRSHPQYQAVVGRDTNERSRVVRELVCQKLWAFRLGWLEANRKVELACDFIRWFDDFHKLAASCMRSINYKHYFPIYPQSQLSNAIFRMAPQELGKVKQLLVETEQRLVA